ncbi:molybdopterin-dependent oxidoreductase [Nonomuraea rubra]|uniref:Molybdopterin oxidoreductase domain-containing protein n=1 Tax=Nonomuraea rubra TaxID=46180 RepID=A0A7X0U0H5_9ACTN|nr:molybdopterin-dependent oxidoreductase [Nonomuraea rubra]MBB6550558.1 hypothetical protein [Nonomuraea rubra]
MGVSSTPTTARRPGTARSRGRGGREHRAAIAEAGPDSVAAISSARATNGENHLIQKFMRVVVGTNNVDNCSRLCHSPSAAGLTTAFGLAGGTDGWEDVEQADCLLVVGANPVEAHPIVGARLLQRVLLAEGLIDEEFLRLRARLPDGVVRARPCGRVRRPQRACAADRARPRALVRRTSAGRHPASTTLPAPHPTCAGMTAVITKRRLTGSAACPHSP